MVRALGPVPTTTVVMASRASSKHEEAFVDVKLDTLADLVDDARLGGTTAGFLGAAET
jgi:hypothetical protein